MLTAVEKDRRGRWLAFLPKDVLDAAPQLFYGALLGHKPITDIRVGECADGIHIPFFLRHPFYQNV